MKISEYAVAQTAGNLLSDVGDNYEYDRAIVEMVHALLNMGDDADKDTTARLLRSAVGRGASIGLVEPAEQAEQATVESMKRTLDAIRHEVKLWRVGTRSPDDILRRVEALLNDRETGGGEDMGQ